MPKIGNRSALERILCEIKPGGIQPDEFTIGQIVERDAENTYFSVANRLTSMVRRGELTKRQIIISGKKTNVFRYPDNPKPG